MVLRIKWRQCIKYLLDYLAQRKWCKSALRVVEKEWAVAGIVGIIVAVIILYQYMRLPLGSSDSKNQRGGLRGL